MTISLLSSRLACLSIHCIKAIKLNLLLLRNLRQKMFEKNIHVVREVDGRTGLLPGAHTLQLENCTSHTHEPCLQVGGELLSQQRWPHKPLGTRFLTLAESAHRCPPHSRELQVPCVQMMSAKNGVLPSCISWTHQDGWSNSPLLEILTCILRTPKMLDNPARKPETKNQQKHLIAVHGHPCPPSHADSRHREGAIHRPKSLLLVMNSVTCTRRTVLPGVKLVEGPLRISLPGTYQRADGENQWWSVGLSPPDPRKEWY